MKKHSNGKPKSRALWDNTYVNAGYVTKLGYNLYNKDSAKNEDCSKKTIKMSIN